MHEFSLAQGLVNQLVQIAEEHQAKKICIVRVEIGTLSGIVIDSFSFGFEVLAAENDLIREAALEILEVEPRKRCLDCSAVFQNDNNTRPQCPECGSNTLMPDGGDDLILAQVEME